MEPSTVSRLRGTAAVILQRLRTLPWLTTAIFICGALFAALQIRAGWSNLAAAGRTGIPLAEGVQNEVIRGEWMHFFRTSWGQATLCLLPAAVLAAFRLRRTALITPIAITCLWLTVYWVGTDLLENLHRSLNDPLGMEPSQAAYTVKLILMACFLLSPPVLLWLYYRATILDRYLLRNFLSPFLICLGGITGLMITMNLLNNANDFIAAGYGLGKILLFYLGQMPRMLVVVTEAALLLATLFSLGKMSRHLELTAMNSTGRSVFRVLSPLLFFAFWCSLAVTTMNYQLAPEGQRVKEETQGVAGNKAARDTAVFNVLYRNREDHRTWYLHSVPYDLSEARPIREVYIWQQNAAGDLIEAWFARSGVWIPETGAWRLRQVVKMDFIDPATGQRRANPRRTPLIPFIEMKTWHENPGSMLSDKLDPDFLGVPALLSCLKSRETLPDKAIARYETTIQWRFALPFRCFLIVLLAAPLGIVASRRNMLGGVSAALGIFVVVFFLSAMLLKSGEGNYLPPFVAAWGTNLILGATGLVLFWFRSKNRRAPSLNPLTWFQNAA